MCLPCSVPAAPEAPPTRCSSPCCPSPPHPSHGSQDGSILSGASIHYRAKQRIRNQVFLFSHFLRSIFFPNHEGTAQTPSELDISSHNVPEQRQL